MENIDQMTSLFKALYSPYYFADLVSKGAQFQTLTITLTVRLRTSLIHVRGRSTCPPFLSPCTKHLAPENSTGVCLKRAFKIQFSKAYFRSPVHPSRKLWQKPNSGNSVPCILPCKICGSWNLMKERYFSKTPFLTSVYLSK